MGFTHDVRQAARSLARSPAATVVAAVTLALGVGATTAMFSIIRAVLLRPLTFADPERLVAAAATSPPRMVGVVSTPDFSDWRRQSHSFADLCGYSTWPGFSLASGDRPEHLPGARVSPRLLAALGARPLLGRSFLPEEELPGRDKVVILGEALWRRRFGGAPEVIGSRVTISGEPRTVVGIVPAWLHFPPDEKVSQLFTPLVPSPAQARSRGNHWMHVVGRLRDGVSVAQAQAELDGIARQLARQFPDTNEGRGVLLTPLRTQLVGRVREPLWILFGAVVLLLLIACVNVANLLLARAISRWRETAVRVALGAGGWRLARRFLAEGLLLALLGGACALPVAWAGLRLVLALAPRDLPRLDEVTLDFRVLAFGLAAACGTGLLFSLAPIWQAGRLQAGELLRAGTRASAGVRGHRLRGLLVMAEMALSLLLLAGAGLLLRTLWNLSRVDPGVHASGVLTAELDLPAARYDTPARITSFYARLLARLAALPGVRASGMISLLPARDWGWNSSLSIVGAPPMPSSFDAWVEERPVSPGYFAALGIGLVRGRLPADSDAAGAPLVLAINEAAARRFWPGGDPLGARVMIGGDGPLRVVGVVRDVHNAGVARTPLPEAYFPYAQDGNRSMTLVLRTAGEPLALVAALRRAVAAEDRELPLDKVTTMEEVLAAAIGPKRFQAAVLGMFAFLAASLAAIGLFGLLGYLVVQRRHEIGVRLALGATAGEVRRLVLGEALRLVLPGLALGLAGAAALRRLFGSLLFGVGPLDVPTLVAVALGLAAVALLACLAPVRRAVRVDPLIALREE
jgi:putative ABC transport system permease protein